MTQLTENQQKEQHNQFKAAKQIALNISAGQFRRARVNNVATNYCGYKDASGRMWVIGDSLADIQNPDATINGSPAREIFGDFSVMMA